MTVLNIVEPIDRPVNASAPLGSLLVSLLAHAVLAIILWCIVYTTFKPQPIFLTASWSASSNEVTFELTPKATAVEPEPEPGPISSVDSHAAIESLISGSVKSEEGVGGTRSSIEPPSIDFFGTRAFGNRFVFVLDISYSMKARNGERFTRACDELLRSVSELKAGQSYYVFLFCWNTEEMFYDSSIHYVDVAPGHERKLRNWIYDVSLGAGTDPRRALALAHRMKPDAVFLLSDGQFNQPQTPLSESGWVDDRGERLEGDVQAGIEMVYRDMPVHTVAFENPFTISAMQQIAEASGGSCRYIPTHPHQPIDSKRFLTLLREIDRKHGTDGSPRQEYQTRLSEARELICDGELVYAEYLVRPLRSADESAIANPVLLTQVLSILDDELGSARLEDFEPAPGQSEILADHSRRGTLSPTR